MRWKILCWSMISMKFIVPYRVRTMKDRPFAEFCREEDDPFLYRARVLPGCEEEYGDGGDGIDPIDDGPPRAFAIRL